MPSSYTADIQKGITFKDFVWKCARSFGPLISLKESFTDEIPKKIEPNKYFLKKLNDEQIQKEKLEKMSINEINEKINSEFNNKKDMYLKIIEQNNKLSLKYQTMLHQVNNWIPPSSNHNSLKEFMKKQILNSLEYDCNNKYYIDEIRNLKKLTADEWLKIKKEEINSNIKEYEEKWLLECESIKQKNIWIKQLRESLK